MKVIRLTNKLDFGGVETRFVLTSQYIDLDNFWAFYAIGNGGKAELSIRTNKKQVHCLNLNFKIPSLHVLYKLYKIFLKEKPDVVHTSAAEANFHGLIAAAIAGVPVRIGEEIGFPNHDWRWRLIFKWVYKSATKVIAISQSVKDRIVELEEVEEEKVEVVYNPVELGSRTKDKGKRGNIEKVEDSGKDEWEMSGISKIEETLRFAQSDGGKPFVFVTTCRLVPVKNLDTLIKVFAELVDENQDWDLKLWIVGDGPERENLEHLVKKLEIPAFVIFLGFKEDVVPFLEQANAFVLPSFSEGFSISLVEAMLCGLPCIVTNKGGPSEIVQDGKSGFLINPYQADDLKSKMIEVLKLSNQQRQLIGEKAQESGRKYSVENYVKRLMEVYSAP